MSQLTKNFKVEDFAVSNDYPDLAKNIKFSDVDKAKLFYLASTILEPAWKALGQIINLSGKRSPELNEAVGGSDDSDHKFEKISCADDFTFARAFDRGVNTKDYIRKGFIWVQNTMPHAFGQLIYYPGKKFIHISLPTPKHQGEVICIPAKRGDTSVTKA
jgi:hypothetical protein